MLVARARKARHAPSGPLVIGFDPAWKGGDRHSMAWRQGRVVTRIVSRRGLDTMEAAGWAKQVIDAERPQKFFIDIGGVGAGRRSTSTAGRAAARSTGARNCGCAPRNGSKI